MWPKTKAVGAVAVALLVASSALAAKKDKKPKKDEGTEHKAGLMEEGGKDPSEMETAEEGQFTPGKTYVPEDEREGAVDENGDPIPQKPQKNGKRNKRGEVVEEPKKEEPRKPPRKTIGVFGEGLIGFGKAPIPSPSNGRTGDATTFAFLVGGHYDVSTSFRLLLRVPWSTASLDNSSSSALGTPEIAGRLRITEPGASEWAVKLGVGIPVAQGQPDVTQPTDAAARAQADVQRLADAANGWHDPELYAPKRLPVSATLFYTYRTGGLRLGADLKAVVMPGVGAKVDQPNARPPGTFENHGVAFHAILGGTAAYEVIDHGYLALAAWAAYRVIEPISYSSDATAPTPFQFAMEPKILAQFGRVVPSIGYVLPLGGQLGGQISGLRLHVDVVF